MSWATRRSRWSGSSFRRAEQEPEPRTRRGEERFRADSRSSRSPPNCSRLGGKQDTGCQVRGYPNPRAKLAQSSPSVRPSVRAGGCFSIAPGHGYERPWSLSREGRVSTATGKLRQGAAVGLGRGTPTTQAHAVAEEENLPWPHLAPAADDERPEKVGKGDSGAKLGVP